MAITKKEKIVRSGIRTHAYMSRLRPERSALDRSAILTSSGIKIPHISNISPLYGFILSFSLFNFSLSISLPCSPLSVPLFTGFKKKNSSILVHISTAPCVLDCGRVAVGSIVERNVTVKNNLKQHVSVTFKVRETAVVHHLVEVFTLTHSQSVTSCSI